MRHSFTSRFDIDDRKGLEIVILTALLTFQDANEAYHSPEPSSSPSSNPLSRSASQVKSNVNNDVAPPKPPPRPAPKTGVDRIAELQVIKGEYNEITISDEGSVEEYGEYCNRLLQVSNDMLWKSLTTDFDAGIRMTPCSLLP